MLMLLFALLLCSGPARADTVTNRFTLGGVAARGKPVYVRMCSTCHGMNGDGAGPAASALSSPPRDYTDATVMSAFTDAYLYRVVREGGAMVGKSPLMGPWKHVLTDQQIRDVVAYIRQFSEQGSNDGADRSHIP